MNAMVERSEIEKGAAFSPQIMGMEKVVGMTGARGARLRAASWNSFLRRL